MGRLKSYYIIRVLLPLSSVALEGDSFNEAANIPFRTYSYVSMLISDVSILLMYGLACPLLGVAILLKLIIYDLTELTQIEEYMATIF